MFTRSVQVVLSALVALMFTGCGSGGGGDDNNADGGGGGETSTVSFAGELAAFPDYGYDSGWLPADSPAQVKLLFSVEGKLTGAAEALVGGSADEPILSGSAGTGQYKLSVKLVFQILVKLDLPGVTYEGPVDENANIVFEVGDEVAFDPFLVGATVPIAAEIPDTVLVTLPLAGSIPGVEGNVIVHISGLINSEFEGACAAINATDAQFLGVTHTSADLVLSPVLEVEIPWVYEETIDVGDIPVAIPAVDLGMDLGTQPVTPGGGAVEGGGSLGTVGSCDDVEPLPDVITGDDTVVGDDVVEPDVVSGTCAADCAGCCAGDECLAGNENTACGTGGGACTACGESDECIDGACVDTTVTDCATQCSGCCAGGNCLAGDADYACGSGGAACVECDPGYDCVNGACIAGAFDCASECPGCCNGDNCLPGTADFACGSDGAACAACDVGESCNAGICDSTPYSCYFDCDGCCLDNVCYPGDDDTACGSGGKLCDECTGDFACVNNACVNQGTDCWATCDGCCQDGECLPGDVATACGSGGAECTGCSANFFCEGGDCVLDPFSSWKVVAISGEVVDTTSDWDDWGGKPDLYAEFSTYYDPDSGYGLVKTTPTVDDTWFASWNVPVFTSIQAQDLLDYGLSIELWDEDLTFDDSIGSCGMAIGQSHFDGTPQSGCGSFGTFEVLFKLVPEQ